MIRKKTFSLLLLNLSLFFGFQAMAQSDHDIKYGLGMSEPETHFFEVHMEVPKVLSNPYLQDKQHLIVKMPVWTPGSYLVREYPGNVDGFIAHDEQGRSLNSRKINKNTWQIDIENAEDVLIDYKVYANTLTVRTSFIDANHGYLVGASIFMFVPELMEKPSELKVTPYEKWSVVSTALPETSKNVFTVKDFDTLVDSPIEIGNHEVLEFEALGIPHKIAMYSATKLNYDKEKLLSDYIKLVEATTSVVGESPLNHYLFIVHHQPGIGGGLEHKFSTTCQTSTGAYSTESAYKGFFALLAHEYFHLWNVKRIRPVALGPFDYEKENYTHMLWVAEGFTNYFEEVILKRAGIYTDEDVLSNHASAINNAENAAGNRVQSVTEASWDAWVKYYRPHENSKNTTVSYYGKGGVLASLLEAKIIANTEGERSLQDVMRLLYQKYYKGLNRGYTDAEFQLACETVYGGSLDYFFERFVSGTETPDYNKIFKGVGLELVDANEVKNEPYIGISERSGYVYRISSNGSAYHSGLSVGDEIVSIDGKLGESFASALYGKDVGDKVSGVAYRNGVKFDFSFELKKDPRKSYSFKKLDKLKKNQKVAYAKFINA
ncbi:MAG: putative metalloprotease with PDZ domain [Arcticibacterium sp.]|jgi:predicted metalloprotease with PDZ domain